MTAQGTIAQRTARRAPVAMMGRLVAIQLATAMTVLGIAPLTPALRDEFGLSRAGAGFLVTAVFLGVVAASWPAGRIVGATGVRRSAIVASLGCGAAMAALAVAPTYGTILLVLLAVGVFYAPVTPATNVGVVAWATAAFRTRAMAIKQMGVTAGAAISAALIPFLTARYGWRIGAVVVGVIVAIVGTVAALGFRRPEGVRARPQPARLEDRSRVLALGISTLLLLFVQHCVSTHFILALQDEGVALVAAGAALSLLQVAATGARFAWAWITDRVAGGNAGLTLLVLCLASAVVLIGMTALDGARWPVPAAILLGMTTQAGNGLIQIVLSDAGGSAPAASSGLGMSLGFFGTVIGPPLFGLLADNSSYRASWFVLAAVAIASGVIAWRSALRVPQAA